MNQSKTLILLILLNVSTNSLCQTGKLEIGINCFEYCDFTKHHDYDLLSGIPSAALGVNYTYSLDAKKSLRLSSRYVSKSSGILTNMIFQNIEAKQNSIDFDFGIQSIVFRNRYTTYIFTDLVQEVGKKSLKIGYFESGSLKLNTAYNYYDIGISSGAGFQLPVTGILFINLELSTSLTKEFNHDRFYRFYNNGIKFAINPVSRFSINYRL